jgi:LPS O-antigen subunit length determinant protein (WzzB/FepE family)
MSGESILLDGGVAKSSQRRSVEERLTARDIFTILWRERIPLVAIPLVITAAVAAAAFLIPAKYEATVLVMPASDADSVDRGGGLGAAVSQLGGLASLAGFSAGGNTLKVEAVATLESEALTARYINQNNLLPVLYGSQWDSARGQWKSSDPKKIPTLWKANRYFRSSVRSIVDNARTGLITMTITWRDPVQAATWANDLVAMTNQYLRDKAIHDAERNIAFLNEQAKSNSVIPVQEAIANLTETQLKKVMYARSREQYALKVLDPATIPEKQSFPRPVLWTASAAIIGMFVAVLFVLLGATGSRERQ